MYVVCMLYVVVQVQVNWIPGLGPATMIFVVNYSCSDVSGFDSLPSFCKPLILSPKERFSTCSNFLLTFTNHAVEVTVPQGHLPS